MKNEIDIQIDATHTIAKQRNFKTGKEGYGFYGKVITRWQKIPSLA